MANGRGQVALQVFPGKRWRLLRNVYSEVGRTPEIRGVFP